jgi:hypothetical protein
MSQSTQCFKTTFSEQNMAKNRGLKLLLHNAESTRANATISDQSVKISLTISSGTHTNKQVVIQGENNADFACFATMVWLRKLLDRAV